MAKKKVPKRGGYRPGAGRKPAAQPTELVGWRLRRATVAAVKAAAAQAGLKPGALADQILSTVLAIPVGGKDLANQARRGQSGQEPIRAKVIAETCLF